MQVSSMQYDNHVDNGNNVLSDALQPTLTRAINGVTHAQLCIRYNALYHHYAYHYRMNQLNN